VQEKPERTRKKNQCEIQESLIISARGGDGKMRWRKKIEQRRSMRTKRPSSGEEEKKEEAWKVAFRALFIEATYVERDGVASTTAVTVSATVYRETGLFSKTRLL
jgi:hypothetical protein